MDYPPTYTGGISNFHHDDTHFPRLHEGIVSHLEQVDLEHRNKLELARKGFANLTPGWVTDVDSNLVLFLNSLPPEIRDRIYYARLSINDYAEKLGLGVASVGVEPLDIEKKPMLSAAPQELDDFQPPTFGSVLTPMALQALVRAGFYIGKGAELFTPLGADMPARTYAHGESVSGLGDWPCIDRSTFPRNKSVLITAGTTLAVEMPVVDQMTFEKMKAAGFPFYPVYPDPNNPERNHSNPQALPYFCRYLTEAAVKKVLAAGR